MLEHLIDFEPEVGVPTNFTTVEKADVVQVVDAKASTAEWLKSLGAVDEDEIVTQTQTEAARKSFTNLVTAAPTELTQATLADVKTPKAVQHLVGMLTAYDWEFVHQAQSLRGYIVAQLVEETKNPSASIRLKALIALGKVTEVGLFTEKVEVKKSELSDIELEARIKEKLS